MISEVRKTFNDFLFSRLGSKKEIFKLINEHQLKEKAIEKTCEELEKANSIMHVVDNRRFTQIVEMASNLYASRVLETLEYNAKSDAEKYRIKKEVDYDKRIQEAIDNNRELDEHDIYG